ncbi:hypothetical protein DFJ63DRAFT_335451 [Scheffersomyces coipomensis]|uniref:uncharacterized protein n=1 Tax=Scheffersomyces coipomensis TaxID=1788519 RepID=UPI00315D70FD
MKRLIRYGLQYRYVPTRQSEICLSSIRLNSTTSASLNDNGSTINDLVYGIFKTDYNKTKPITFKKGYPTSKSPYDIISRSSSSLKKGGSESLGNSFLVYFQSYQLIFDPKGFEKDIVTTVNELINGLSRDLQIEPEKVNQYVSDLITNDSKDDINRIFQKYHHQDKPQLNTIVNALGATLPIVKGREINFSYIYTDKENQPTVTNYELPKIIKELKFNPLLLFNDVVLKRYDKKLIKNDESVLKKWNLLYNFGLTSIEFHANLIPNSINLKDDSSDKIIKMILQDSSIHRVIIFPKSRKMIEDLIITNKEFRKQLFYQYIGVKTLIDGFPIAWFTNLSSINQVTNEDSNDMFEDWINVAPAYIKSKATILQNSLDNETVDPTLLRTVTSIDHTFDRFIYKSIQQFEIPLPIIKPVELRTALEKNLPFKSPSLGDTNLTRFKLLNNAIIRPNTHNTHQWVSSNNIKRVIVLQDKVGDESYRTLVKYYLSNEEGLSEEIMESLSKILTSLSFKLFLIEFNEFYNNQSLRGASYKFLFDKYLQYRFMNNFHSNQFNQYFATLSIEQQQMWIKSMVEFFIKVVKALNYDQTLQFLQECKNVLNKKQSVLVDISKQRIIERACNSNVLSQFIDNYELRNYEDQTENGLKSGKHYLNYSIMRFNLKSGLISFISSTEEIQDIFNSLYPNHEHFNYIGYKVQTQSRFESEIHKAIRLLYDLNPTRLFDPTIKLDNINYDLNTLPTFTNSLTVEMKNQFLDEFMLPYLSDFYDVNKLMVVNYTISRTFFQQIGVLEDGPSRNMNRYPDLISMISSIGFEYYQYLIYKSFKKFESHIPNSKDVYPRVFTILNDKKFKLIVTNGSTNSLSLFKSNNHNVIYKQLYQQYCQNDYYKLRFHNAQFDQYLGSIVITEPFMIDKWFQDTVEPLLIELSQSDSSHQSRILDQIEIEIKSYDLNST